MVMCCTWSCGSDKCGEVGVRPPGQSGHREALRTFHGYLEGARSSFHFPHLFMGSAE
jgi:hypothetical protein